MCGAGRICTVYKYIWPSVYAAIGPTPMIATRTANAPALQVDRRCRLRRSPGLQLPTAPLVRCSRFPASCSVQSSPLPTNRARFPITSTAITPPLPPPPPPHIKSPPSPPHTAPSHTPAHPAQWPRPAPSQTPPASPPPARTPSPARPRPAPRPLQPRKHRSSASHVSAAPHSKPNSHRSRPSTGSSTAAASGQTARTESLPSV